MSGPESTSAYCSLLGRKAATSAQHALVQLQTRTQEGPAVGLQLLPGVMAAVLGSLHKSLTSFVSTVFEIFVFYLWQS